MTNEELVALIQAGENVEDNLAQLYEQNLPMITRIVFPFTKAAELDDLTQEAFFGLKKAAEQFDFTLGFKFTTYMDWPIRASVQRYLQNCGQTIRIPPHMVEKISKYQKFKADFTAVVGREPTNQEYQYHLMVTPKELSELRKYMVTSSTISIDQALPGAEDFTLADTLPDEYNLEETVVEDVASDQAKKALWDAVNDLGGRYPKIIEGQFRNGETLETLGGMLNISKDRVRQLRDKGIKLLRHSKKAIEASEIFGYDCDQAYHYGFSRFKDTGSSSTEFLAIKHIEQEEQQKQLKEESKELSSTVNLSAYRLDHIVGYVPTGLKRLQELNVEIERQMAEIQKNRLNGRKKDAQT